MHYSYSTVHVCELWLELIKNEKKLILTTQMKQKTSMSNYVSVILLYLCICLNWSVAHKSNPSLPGQKVYPVHCATNTQWYTDKLYACLLPPYIKKYSPYQNYNFIVIKWSFPSYTIIHWPIVGLPTGKQVLSCCSNLFGKRLWLIQPWLLDISLWQILISERKCV